MGKGRIGGGERGDGGVHLAGEAACFFACSFLGQCPVGARGGHQQRMASWQMYSGNPGLKLLKSGANKATSVLSNSRHGPFKRSCRSHFSHLLWLL